LKVTLPALALLSVLMVSKIIFRTLKFYYNILFKILYLLGGKRKKSERKYVMVRATLKKAIVQNSHTNILDIELKCDMHV